MASCIQALIIRKKCIILECMECMVVKERIVEEVTEKFQIGYAML